MKHIKTPVARTVWGDIADANGLLIFEAAGPVSASDPRVDEAITVLNAHDALVAERDALAEALEGLTCHLAEDWPLDAWNDDNPARIQTTAGDIRRARAALAKVRGEGE